MTVIGDPSVVDGPAMAVLATDIAPAISPYGRRPDGIVPFAGSASEVVDNLTNT